MNHHALRVLEFEAIRARVLEYALTDAAADLVAGEGFLHTPGEIAGYHRISELIRRCRQTTVESVATRFPPLGEIIRRLQKDGVVLEPEEFAAVRVFLSSATAIRRYYAAAMDELDEDGTPLANLVDAIPVLPQIISRISKLIDEDGTVREREIPELRAVRSQISRAEQELAQTASGIIAKEETRRYWNATVPTQREGRVVLPLKADHRGKVKGIVQETSASGATVFVEPEAVVELNNRVAEARSRYRTELLRLLRELSAACRAEIGAIDQCNEAVIAFDRYQMRALYADRLQAESPHVGGKRLTLRSARHPLLSEPVPIELVFPPGKRLLIITGPNTGGKTVSLKTVGLLALMNQFGLQIPASAESELPVFDEVLADIGDEQSIEQNLSTFSGHMQNIARILSLTSKRSLVLLDELGSGTDPQEGGALARAILDEIVERQPFTVVTTHHGVLKHYGYTRQIATNASVEFDAQSLRPTYHIVPGVPGASHAVEIAAGQGLPQSTISAADRYLSGEEQDVSSIIRRLTTEEQRLRERVAELEREQRKIDSERERLASREATLEKSEREIREGKLRELDTFAADARRRLENLVRELREGELTKERTRSVKEYIAKLDEGLAAQAPQADGPRGSQKLQRDGSGLCEGAEVVITAGGKRGTIQRRGKGSTWIVQSGALKLPVEASELRRVDPVAATVKPSVEYSGGTSAAARFEVDVRGMRLTEAQDVVTRQIDAALLSGMQQFGVIHGTGTGVLQEGIRDLLSRHPSVGRFEYAHPEQGGFGKTLVTLD